MSDRKEQPKVIPQEKIDAIEDTVLAEIMTGCFVNDGGEPPLTGGFGQWRAELGHPHSGHGYCRTCGPAASCQLGVYVDAIIETTVRRTLQLAADPDGATP